MSHIEVSIDISRALPDVWDAVSRLDRHAEWMKDAESIVFLDDQTSGVGTAMEVLTRIGPFSMVDRMVVNEWTPTETIAVSHHGTISGERAFHLTETETGTRFVWRECQTFPWYFGGRLTAIAARRVLKRIWRSNLRMFSATLDESAPEWESQQQHA